MNEINIKASLIITSDEGIIMGYRCPLNKCNNTEHFFKIDSDKNQVIQKYSRCRKKNEQVILNIEIDYITARYQIKKK